MCLAVPGKIEEINASGPMTMAKVNFNGIFKEICIEWISDAKVGDYVIVHAGFAISILDKEEALENLRLIKEVAQGPDAYLKW
ncbi:HypC/HybG/HupF family hydrogenase formation chaperone [bacterium]|nr:HypC/HybG/HupF family hydrogenase formation chaperone [bacterium]